MPRKNASRRGGDATARQNSKDSPANTKNRRPAQAPSWRDVIPVHPAAEFFPPLSETDPAALKKLGEDIKAHGLTSPVVIVREDGRDSLLDGRNRLDALELIGHRLLKHGECSLGPCGIQYFVPTARFSAYDFVISANIHRRHLTVEQKRDLITKLLKATPEKSDRQIAGMVKASPTTVGTVRAKMEATGDVSNLDTRRDTKGRQQPARKRAGAQLRKVLRADRAENLDQKGDIGPSSSAELVQLQARIGELESENHRLEHENAALRRRIVELEKATASAAPPADDDGLGIPDFLRRAAP
jgi:hypothetical protein